MPTLDDAPTLEALATVELDASNAGNPTTISTKDLVVIYDIPPFRRSDRLYRC